MVWRTYCDAVRYYLAEGYRVARMRCQWCEIFQITAIPPNCTCEKFECLGCGRIEASIVKDIFDAESV